MSIQTALTALGNAIRSKTGTTETMSIDEMATAVETIKAGSDPVVITSADYLFSGQIPESIYPFVKIVEPAVMNHMYFQNDTIIDIDMRKLNFIPNPAAVACNNMFYTCDQTNSIALASGIKARSVMSMFQGCSKLTSINFNGLDVSECSDFRSFLNGCKMLLEFDGAIFPTLSVANNNCQLFFSTTTALRKVWIPKEWHIPPTTAGYSPFVSNGGSNAMNKNLQIFTDATSEAEQIASGNWSKFTMVYNSSGTAIPAAQVHYGATHAEYEAY